MSAKKLSKGEKKVVAAWNGSIKETAEKAKMSYGYVQRVVKKSYIIEKLSKREDKQLAGIIADRQERQAFWSSVMRGDPQVVDLIETKDPETGEVTETIKVTKVADMKNRLKAAELLGRSEADFIDKYHLLGAKEGVKKEITDEMDQKEASNIYFGMLKGGVGGNA